MTAVTVVLDDGRSVVLAPALPVEPLERVFKMPSFLRVGPRRDGSTDVRVHDVDQQVAALEAAWAADQVTHERNLAAIEWNQKIWCVVRAVMDAVGTPASFQEPVKSSRSRYPRTVKMDAGYLGDLRRAVKISDRFIDVQSRYQQLREGYGEARKVAEANEAKRAAQGERAKAAKAVERELVARLLQLGLPIDGDWADVLRVLRLKDQYLDLALAMEDARNGELDESAWMVHDALSRFSIGNDQDKETAAGAVSALTEFADDGDRRAFVGFEALYEIAKKRVSAGPSGMEGVVAWARSARDALQRERG